MNNLRIKTVLGILVLSAWISGCTSTTSASACGDAPAEHTVQKGGVCHKSGLSNPEINCTSCHGATLQGGTSGTSCFKCHGKKW